MPGKYILSYRPDSETGGPGKYLLSDGPDDLEGKTLEQHRADQITWEGTEPGTEPASWGSALTSGIADDTDTRIRHFASQRFPNEPIEQAAARYDFDKTGDLIFRTDDGKRYRELDTGGEFAQFVGNAGPSLVGGTAGLIKGGAKAAVRWAMAGGAAGETSKKVGAQVGLGQPVNLARDVADVALVVAGEGLGAGAVKGGIKYRDRRTAADYDELTRTGRADAENLIEIAAREGIHLTPAEALNLQSLKQQQTYLGSTFGPAGNKVNKMYEGRNANINAAVERHLPQAPHLTTAGGEAKTVFDKTIKDVRAARTAEVTPQYEAVVHPGSLLSDESFAAIKANPYLSEHIAAIKASKLHNEIAAMPENSLPVLDAVKKRIDGQIEKAKLDPELRWEVSELQRHKKMLLDATDTAFPDYKKSRDAFAQATPEVKEAEQSLEGIVSRMSDKRAAEVPDAVFSATKNTAGPVQVGRARHDFLRQGKEAEWDNSLNAWLRKQWEGTPDRRVNPASTFYDKIYGSETKRNIIKAAMGPERFTGFNDLMRVLEATTRVQRGQSITHFAGEAARADKRKAMPPGVGTASAILTAKPSAAREWLQDFFSGRYNEKLADMITTPGSLDRLKELRKLAPDSEQALKIVGSVLGWTGQAKLKQEFDAGNAGVGRNP